MKDFLSYQISRGLKRVLQIASAEHGNVAMIFAISMIPILGVAGFAIDYSRQMSSDQHVQMAVDSASLAAARALEDSTKSDAEIVTIARASFDENLNSAYDNLDCGEAAVSIDRVTGLVEVGAQCDLPTWFGGILQKDEVQVANRSVARASITKLDLALMLDVSGSMSGQKLADLKTAAKSAAATLITPQTGNRVRISFDSYATSVNAGAYAPSVLSLGGLPGVSDCATERSGPDAWNDAAPGIGSWLGNATTSCPSSSVLPLTSDLTVFNAAIDTLSAGGSTAGHLGVAWAWYLISPEWDAVWPAGSKPLVYTEPESKKAVILMTDGQFNTRFNASLGNSNQQAKKMCEKMRDKGVIVYAVAFQAPNSAKDTLKDCAGDVSRFFEAGNGTELQDAYAAIASELANLSLVS